MSKHQLETYKWFPYVAWTVCIFFALFVYHLTINLQEAKSDLAVATTNLEKNSRLDPQLIPFNDLQKTGTTSTKVKLHN